MKRGNNGSKVIFVSSSGGHLEQLKCLKPLMKKYDSVIATEKTKIHDKADYYLAQTGHKDKLVIPKMALLFLQTAFILLKEKPFCIISTGTIVALPFAILAKVLHIKFIYIESFAKRTDPTMSGNFIYKYHLADMFIVQWETMKKVYPNAIYGGCIY